MNQEEYLSTRQLNNIFSPWRTGEQLQSLFAPVSVINWNFKGKGLFDSCPTKYKVVIEKTIDGAMIVTNRRLGWLPLGNKKAKHFLVDIDDIQNLLVLTSGQWEIVLRKFCVQNQWYWDESDEEYESITDEVGFNIKPEYDGQILLINTSKYLISVLMGTRKQFADKYVMNRENSEWKIKATNISADVLRDEVNKIYPSAKKAKGASASRIVNISNIVRVVNFR
jgi:hypothetical protein